MVVRPRIPGRALVVVVAVAALVTTGLPTAAHAATGPRPGLVGAPLLLQDNTQLHGYDVAVDGAGTAYVGWIADDSSTTSATRKVRFCTLPPGSASCAGGVQVIDALGASSAAGLRVLATAGGTVTLVWFHDTDPGSVTGPRGGRIAVATSQGGGPLSAATDVADAPSFGQLLDAQLGPGGALWTVAYKGVGTTEIEVRPGVTSAPQAVPVPYSVATTRLAFAGSTPVIAAQQYGGVSAPIHAASGTGGGWSGFAPVANTWSVGSVGLAAATSGVRLVAAIANASYYPVVSRFTGSGFTRPTLTGDRNSCAPYSHDLVADASGRLADVSNECGQITVANMAAAGRAGLVRFAAGGTVAGGDPQIATTPRGHARVAWSIQSTTGNKLLVGRVLLPALAKAVTKKSRQGKVTVKGPASCLPASSIAVGVKARPAKGWKAGAKSLRLDGKRVTSPLSGAKLAAASTHTLTGRVVFSRAGQSVARTVKLTFRSCASP